MGGVYFAYDTPDHDFFAPAPKGYQALLLEPLWSARLPVVAKRQPL